MDALFRLLGAVSLIAGAVLFAVGYFGSDIFKIYQAISLIPLGLLLFFAAKVIELLSEIAENTKPKG